jgi:hypothetical protein
MINFFNVDCQELTSATQFGLCDDEDKLPAYISFDKNANKWIAEVTNENAKTVVFTAIDNCIPIYKADNPEEMESRIDGMLTYDNEIVFVELKDRRANWIQDGIEQIRNMIIIFSKNHDLLSYNKRRAFLANRQKPHFQHSQKQKMQQFKNELGVRLIIHKEIKI